MKILNLNKTEFKKILLYIALVAALMDSFVVLKTYKNTKSPQSMLELGLKLATAMNSNSNISDNLQNFNLNTIKSSDPIFYLQLIQQFQKMKSLMFIVMTALLAFHFLIYFYLYRWKNWARIYLITVAMTYLLSSLMSFNLIYFIYGACVLILLFKYGKFFKTERIRP